MKISNYILNELIKYNLIKKEYSIDSYYYGIITGLTLLLNFISSLFICFTLGKTKEFFVFFIFFVPLRSFSGGLHLHSRKTCFVISTVIIIIIVQIQNILLNFSTSLFVIALLCSLYIFFCKKPYGINRSIDEKAIIHHNKWKKIFLILDIIFFLFFTHKNSFILANIILCCIILVAMLIIFASIQFEIFKYLERYHCT